VIDWNRIEGFDWDDGNLTKNAVKHSVLPAESEEVFVDPDMVVARDALHSRDEKRFHAFGLTKAGRALHVTFTLRRNGAFVRIVSARPMNAKERRHYAEESKKNSEIPQ
jgi:uncharacterized DUF497 family protein